MLKETFLDPTTGRFVIVWESGNREELSRIPIYINGSAKTSVKLYFSDGTVETHTDEGNTQVLPNIQPLINKPQTGGTYAGLRFQELVLGILVLAGVTLLLPKKYGIWIPFFILMAYMANNTKTFNGLIAFITSSVKGIQEGVSN